MNLPRSTLKVLVTFVLSIGLSCAVLGSDAISEQQWYVVLIEGQRVGWMHTEVTESPDDGQIETNAQTQITLRRGRLDMRIAIGTRFIETSDGKPIEAQTEQTLGKMSTTQAMYFKADTVEVVSRQGGQESRSVKPMPAVIASGDGQEWLPPAAAQRYVQQMANDGEDQIRFWTVDPAMGLDPVHVWMARGEPEVVEAYGRVVPATAWDTTVFGDARHNQSRVPRCAWEDDQVDAVDHPGDGLHHRCRRQAVGPFARRSSGDDGRYARSAG